MLDFPPCFSIEHLEIAEHFIFGLVPSLTTFIRETTAIERAVGISDTHALVTNGERGITRVYGRAISLN
jgi:hypothetical protein